MEAPPTPPVALARLLADHELGLRHLAGPAEAELHGVHASEMTDPSPYLLGGELLLTAGEGLAVAGAWPAGGTEHGAGGRTEPPSAADGGPAGAGPADTGVRPGHGDAGHPPSGHTRTDRAGTGRAWAGHAGGGHGGAGPAEAGQAGAGHGGAGHAEAGQAGAGHGGAGQAGGELIDAGPYVARLVRAGVGAIGFGVTPVHETVPRALIEACARHGLPLVEVPPGTPFTAVGRSVWRLMARARTAELRRVTEAQQSLAAAAARPDPVPAVLRRLAATLGGWAGLLPTPLPDTPAPTEPAPGGAAPADTAGSGPVPAPEVLDVLRTLARRVAPGSAVTATAAHDGLHLSVHALGDGWVLAVATPARAPGDHTVASVAAVLLTLLTARRPAGAEAALTRLLLGGEPAGALGPGPWYAVHARGAGDPRALAAALGTALLDPREDSPHRGIARAGLPRTDSVRLLTDREPTPQPGWRLGVSAPAPAEGLPGADAQAGRALERAEAARTPLARHTEPGLAGLVGAAEARTHAEALLGPLSPALRDTLRGWLAHHGSWDRSAAALGIHRNTVRQRIARTAALLGGADLDDPDTRMELWFALRCSPVPPGALLE
ncbi:helix-turn-helix domain-containing protein [Streptomyces sp. NBC_01298]|uniref:helix-turn-helix domain-containing protein n=1 Tax=Streptomyces sp. NBC_01298 TaxID=2903817 RepID=UPI002E125E63|nr:helix-turn-helix domain-containing protein [Streptomyces sp. NBC_01298]